LDDNLDIGLLKAKVVSHNLKKGKKKAEVEKKLKFGWLERLGLQ